MRKRARITNLEDEFLSAMSQSAQVNDLVRRDNKFRPISSEDFFLGTFPPFAECGRHSSEHTGQGV
jgi:hypothetical protein